MKDIGIDKREGTVVFGQVDGMGDQVSYGLGKYYNFKGYLHLIYPNELEIKDTTDTQKTTSYLDIHFEIDNGRRLKTNFYVKRDDFTFPIVDFPFISSNISLLTRYFRACDQYSDFLGRAQLRTQKLLK
jgi:hypothetical protein